MQALWSGRRTYNCGLSCYYCEGKTVSIANWTYTLYFSVLHVVRMMIIVRGVALLAKFVLRVGWRDISIEYVSIYYVPIALQILIRKFQECPNGGRSMREYDDECDRCGSTLHMAKVTPYCHIYTFFTLYTYECIRSVLLFGEYMNMSLILKGTISWGSEETKLTLN